MTQLKVETPIDDRIAKAIEDEALTPIRVKFSKTPHEHKFEAVGTPAAVHRLAKDFTESTQPPDKTVQVVFGFGSVLLFIAFWTFNSINHSADLRDRQHDRQLQVQQELLRR